MKRRIFVALMILIAFLSISVISASEISVNDTYVGQDSSVELLAIDNGDVGSDSSNILSTNNVDANVDENTIGASNESSTKEAVHIDAPDIDLYYKNGTRFVASLFDADNNKLANQSLIFSISGVNYTRVTNADGQASIAINLIPGTYTLNVYYNGNDNYSSTETSALCSVYPTISGNDMVKYYRNGTQYYATFLDDDGSPLANTDVTFNINGVFYTRTTNTSGVAKLNINLPPNEYILTAIHPNTGYMKMADRFKAPYSVHFDKNAIDAAGTMGDEAFATGEKKALTANSYSRDGFAFLSWNTKANGTGRSFADGAEVSYLTAELSITLYAQWRDLNPAYSHTSNIDDNGTQNSNYGNNWTNANITGTDRGDSSKAHVVTLPDAKTIKVTITYGGESASYDYACVWEGSHPDYTAANNYSSSLSGKLGGGSHTSASNTKIYTIDGNAVTFGFESDVSGAGDGYGYYAVIEKVS